MSKGVLYDMKIFILETWLPSLITSRLFNEGKANDKLNSWVRINLFISIEMTSID